MNRAIFPACMILLLIAAFFFTPPGVQAQVQDRIRGRSYFPHTLVVKFEDEETLRSIRLKSGSNPREKVREYLTVFGSGSFKPVWPKYKRVDLNRRKSSGTTSTSGATSRPSSTSFDDPAGELRRIFTVQYLGDIDPAFLAAKVSKMPGVEYAEPKYIRRTQGPSSDPQENNFESYHNFKAAWDIGQGDRAVLIAIVDAGIGYNHFELYNKLWINDDEIPQSVFDAADQNSDGVLTRSEIVTYLEDNSGDYNGDGTFTLRDAVHEHDNNPFITRSDTDGNGFVDDIFGWDFWSGGGFNGEPVEDDNNPIIQGTDHGTHVAGIAAAETDNGSGIAGAGYDSRYMAIKAGGIDNDPTTPGDESLSIGFGFEAILYAVENGADIINCSWGGSESSQAEEDIIDFATDMGSIVVAAAGNFGAESVFYPAAYSNALAVGSIETNGVKSDYSNFGYNLDVLATGTAVTSIGCDEDDPDNDISSGPKCTYQFEQKAGTSMSTPIVSGLAALLKARHPGWSPQRIAGQIRSTATPVNPTNPSQRDRLGNGSVNAQEALDSPKPSIRISGFEFINTEGKKLGLREEGEFRFTLKNYGANTQNLSVSITTYNEEGIELPDPILPVGSLSTEDEEIFSVPIRITDEFDPEDTPFFKLQFTDNSTSYSDFRVVSYQNLMYDVMDHNGIKMSFAADGTIGFTDPLRQDGGVGFVPREKENNDFVNGDNMLFEGGLIVEANGEVYDAVRDVGSEVSRDFNPREVFRLDTPGSPGAALEGSATFLIGEPDNPTANIRLTSYAFDETGRNNVVYVRYEVENSSSFFELENLYLGLFNDWDIGKNVGNNGAAYVEEDSVLYLYDQSSGSSQPYVAVAHLGASSSALAIDNAAGGNGLNFGLYDGYTDAEKIRSLRAGTGKTSVASTDASAVIASGPFTLSAKASISVGFVYAFGSDLSELRSQISQARSNVPFQVSQKGRAVSTVTPERTEVFQNYPNPFNPTTRIRLDLSQPSDVNLTIYNVLGQKVAELVDGRLDARIHIFKFDANNLSSGLYFARLTTDNRVRTLKMVLVK